MSAGGTKARENALRSVEQSGAEQIAALSGMCVFLCGFFVTGVLVPAALLSFWVCFGLIGCAIGIGAAVYGFVSGGK